MASPGHLLSLKVMRVSRPSLASAWEPFYSSSPSFSAHSTASLVSLQGKTALPGHPKTLRDLSYASEVLMLPSSFGAIQLGETFTSCISINSEADVDVESISLVVEMQTGSMKTVLAEFGGSDTRLSPGESLERVVNHEIKELGQHALSCTVSYRIPAEAHIITIPATDLSDPNLRVFRKFYKFPVTNPLSVKTKVHVPRAPSALFSKAERGKVFLEIHVQNLTEDAMWLERMHLESADGWQVQDVNMIDVGAELPQESIFSGSMALMQPQDMRQYLYILSPQVLAIFPETHQPGSIVPLGRLDISWRSSFGEPGRLLTSMLSRRIPLIQAPPVTPTQPPAPLPKQLVSAIPPRLQRTSSLTGGGTPPRPRSPQLTQRPTSPPATSGLYRPGSPFRNRTTTASGTQSPVPVSPNPPLPHKEDVEVDLVVRSIPRDEIKTDVAFSVGFTLNISAPVPIRKPHEECKARLLSIVVQHVQPVRSAPDATSTAAPAAARDEPYSPHVASSGAPSPSPYGTPYRGNFQDLLARSLLVASPRRMNLDEDDPRSEIDEGIETPAPPGAHASNAIISLPPPFQSKSASATSTSSVSNDVAFIGNSVLVLPQVRLIAPREPVGLPSSALGHERNISSSTTDSEADSELDEATKSTTVNVVVSEDFELSYMPRKQGFATFGGLRVVLVEDRLVDADEEAHGAARITGETRILKEWDTVGEIWVESH